MREGETLISVELLELDPGFHRRLVDRTGGHPEEMRAGLVSSLRERAVAGRIVGTVASSSRPGERPPRGTRIAVESADAELVVSDITGWDGESPAVPVGDGYAILAASAPFTVLTDRADTLGR